MPEEVNIDELLDLKTDGERTHRLQVTAHHTRLSFCLYFFSVSCVAALCSQDILHSCPKSTAVRICRQTFLFHTDLFILPAARASLLYTCSNHLHLSCLTLSL